GSESGRLESVTRVRIAYRFVELTIDAAARTGNLVVRAPDAAEDPDKLAAAGPTPAAGPKMEAAGFTPAAGPKMEAAGSPPAAGPKMEAAGFTPAAGAEPWSLRAFRELDDALLRLRFDYSDIGMVTVRTSGRRDVVKACDEL